MKKEPASKNGLRKALNFIIAVSILCLLAVLMGNGLGPIGPGSQYPRQSAAMQQARSIGLCLYQYSLDHDGHYPEGKTSTEVFQHLIDEKYVSDSSLFYFPDMPGKVKPSDNHLKAENVCWDVTCCVDSSSPDKLPVVFLTGFKITYQAGASVNPISPQERTWSEWWNGVPRQGSFIAVCYKNNSARTMHMLVDVPIFDFIPADFDAKGKTYRQLTP